MENKCNKTPNNKFLDHVYCHSSESKNYIRTNNSAGGNGGTVSAGQDMMAVIKENKHLKAMLILHLDLIQEQSDQLMSKDKIIKTLREETENLTSKNLQVEAHVHQLQKQLQRQMKRVAAAGAEVSTLPPPPLAKIQSTADTDTNIVQLAKTDEAKFPKEEQPPKQRIEKGVKMGKKNYKIQENKSKFKSHAKTVGKKATNIIGECNGKLISKIILHRVNTTGLHSPTSTASDSASEAEEFTKRQANDTKVFGKGKHFAGDDDGDDWYARDDGNDGTSFAKRKEAPAKLWSKTPRGAKPRKPMSCISSIVSKVGNAQSTPSRGGKQMPLMLTHAPDLHSDESASDSGEELQKHTTCMSVTSSRSLCPKDATKHQQKNFAPPGHNLHHHYAKTRRCGYISTPQRYCTRAWEDDEWICDYEFMKDYANVPQNDLPPMLEIPKWTEHEIPVLYCLEGTEDVSDETFQKRHAKLELDEKRRKKWDVQQIREQRRIEKLKRRHCKDEVQNSTEQQLMHSFYPPPDAIQTICYVNDLPVQAFGELIPKLSTNTFFMLPWLSPTSSSSNQRAFNSVSLSLTAKMNTSSHQGQRQTSSSSFIFMKKRRRQQSSSAVIANTKQRAANAAVATKTIVGTTTSLETTVNSPEATKK